MSKKKDWLTLLNSSVFDDDFNKYQFLDENIDIIPGPNRDAKRKRLNRAIETFKYKGNVKPKKLKVKEDKKPKEPVVENSIFNAPKYDLNVRPEESITFGVISDTHFSSKYAQMTYLHEYYNLCKEMGITDIYHAGDITDGECMRPGHTYENYRHGADEHIKEVVKNYPKIDGITTHFICGNHDASFRKLCGMDIGEQIQYRRSDLHYLGRDVATINITDKITMMLKHNWDGTAYAVSYKPQKTIESLVNTQLCPDILVLGHYHKLEYLYYLGVHCLQSGCFQGATPFTVGKGLRVSLGGWIVTITTDKEGKIKTFCPQAVTYKTDIMDDYLKYY